MKRTCIRKNTNKDENCYTESILTFKNNYLRMKRISFLFFFVILSFHTLFAQLGTTLKIYNGLIHGKLLEKKSVVVFRGIPYAAPPLGELRWKAPQPVVNWDGVRECVNSPASAMQPKPRALKCWTKEFLAPAESISEDCLCLNVWTSARKVTDKLPVIVWIHGGAFMTGSGSVPLYDGEEISKKGCVFVTINYRLGVFGFLSHPELSAESDMKVSGNYGILDQIASLKWVKQNIAAFGGNPDNVTIAGQSAGAMSVNALMVSPLAKGLFQRAIAESGGLFTSEIGFSKSFQEAETDGKVALEKAGIKNMAELRKKSASEIMSISGSWMVAVDNVVIPPFSETFEKRKQNDVPLLTGWNADDGVYFGHLQDAITFTNDAIQEYGSKGNEFLKLFPAETDDQAKESQKLVTQLSFGLQNYIWAKKHSLNGKSKVWVYYFSHIPPGKPNFGAFHASEFAYALHTLKYWERPFTDWDYQLENIMSTYWVNFARNGNPNGKNLPQWPSFKVNKSHVVEFGEKVNAREMPFQEQLKFMENLER